MEPFMYAMSVETFVPALRMLSQILEKGREHAQAKKFDVAVLLNARLSPDMFPLVKQVQVACRHAREAPVRLAGQEPVAVEDKEQTLEELTARITTTLDALGKTTAASLEGSETRRIELRPAPDRVFVMTGLQFLRDWALPNFHFHVVTAYAILRHNGVELGKRDFMSHAAKYLRETHPSVG